MIESPLDSIEKIVDEVLEESQMEDLYSTRPQDLKQLRKALLKGATKDNDVLKGLVKWRDEVLSSTMNLTIEEQLQEYENCRDYIRTTAMEFGYQE